jgi:hypothetical protein
MKPCLKNKQSIALLAVDALGAETADKLRQHLGACPGCHRYWEEISKTCQEHLAAAEALPEAPASPGFHQRLVQRINRSEAPSGSMSVGALLRNWLASRQVVLATAAAALVLLLTVLAPSHDRSIPYSGTPAPNNPSANAAKIDPQPTLSNYRMAANVSLDALDDLLTRQAGRRSTPTEVLTVSTIDKLKLAD